MCNACVIVVISLMFVQDFHSVVAKGFNLLVYGQTKTEQSRLMELKKVTNSEIRSF